MSAESRKGPAAEPAAGAGPRLRPPAGLLLVTAATSATLFLGFAWKYSCLGVPWDGRQYTRLCYSDIYPLYFTEGLSRGSRPYLDHPVEYPVLTGAAMALANLGRPGGIGFFVRTAVLLAAAAEALSVLVALHARRPAAYAFALAPSLLLYAFMNWDLLAAALGTAGVVLWWKGRREWGGFLMGLGAAAKLYPVLFLGAGVLEAARRRRLASGVKGLGAGGLALLLTNLPVVAAAPRGWAEFFRLNAGRPADWDSLWFLAERVGRFRFPSGELNLLSLGLFLALAAAVAIAYLRRPVSFPALCLAVLVCFLLSNKVYSPQYAIWLLPLVSLAWPGLGPFILLEGVGIALFASRFLYFARLVGVDGLPIQPFLAAVALRAPILGFVSLRAWKGHQLLAGDFLEA